MRPRRLRIPMFAKFLIGCLALAALLIVGGTIVVKNETKQRASSSYLVQAVRRLNGYVDRVGRSVTAFTEVYANDSELQRALSTPATAAPPAPTPDATGAPATAAPPDTSARARLVSEVGRRLYQQLEPPDKASADTHWALDPDLFAIFSDTKLLFANPQSPLRESDLPMLGAVAQARNGNLFTHRVHLVRDVPYIVSAFPVRSSAGDVVGGVLIGIRIERIFIEWSRQSDEDPVKQMRPTLLDGVTVLASAWPDRAAQPSVARAIQPEKHFKMEVFGSLRNVTRIGDEIHDVHVDDFDAYKGLDNTKIGRLYLTRSRAAQPDMAKLPITEILVAIIASVIIALLLAYWVTRPIKQMVKQSRELLAGETDLTQRIIVSSSDETADLAENINQVFARVHDLAKEVQDAAFQVGNSSAEISAASRQMLTGLKDQTLKIESSTTAVTELSASIQQVAGNAAQATDVAEQSSTAVNSAVQRMEQIRSAVDEAASRMRDLGESSKRIGNIVEVIRQISEQTSMLALNASIEAAHAGEQGRGFAVVADEVSSLARRVGQSAKDIEALIQTVKEQTAAAITSMDIGAREVLGGTQLVTGTLTGLSQLIMVVKETAGAVHEQAVVSDEIARNMDAVRMLAGEALHGSEESVSSASRLHDLAFQLEESIQGFNLEGQKVVSSRGAASASDASGPQRALPAGRRKPGSSREAND